MAIQISVKSDNGVVLSYHKISLINIEVNQQITILVHSYIDADGRQYDKDYEQGKIVGEPTFPYVGDEYIHIQWEDIGNLLVGNLMENVYEWLKTQPKFEGAIDV